MAPGKLGELSNGLGAFRATHRGVACKPYGHRKRPGGKTNSDFCGSASWPFRSGAPRLGWQSCLDRRSAHMGAPSFLTFSKQTDGLSDRSCSEFASEYSMCRQVRGLLSANIMRESFHTARKCAQRSSTSRCPVTNPYTEVVASNRQRRLWPTTGRPTLEPNGPLRTQKRSPVVAPLGQEGIFPNPCAHPE